MTRNDLDKAKIVLHSFDAVVIMEWLSDVKYCNQLTGRPDLSIQKDVSPSCFTSTHISTLTSDNDKYRRKQEVLLKALLPSRDSYTRFSKSSDHMLQSDASLIAGLQPKYIGKQPSYLEMLQTLLDINELDMELFLYAINITKSHLDYVDPYISDIKKMTDTLRLENNVMGKPRISNADLEMKCGVDVSTKKLFQNNIGVFRPLHHKGPYKTMN